MTPVSRRTFLGQSALTAGLAPLALSSLTSSVFVRSARAGEPGPNGKVRLGIIGCGGMGQGDLACFLQNPEVDCVMVCDVDDARIAKGVEICQQKRGRKPDTARDFRRVLDRKDVDAVLIATGKHVYCEKPLTWCIAEARRMAETARKHKLATQMGTQGMAAAGSRAGVEVVRSGVLGPVRELHVWTDRAKGWWPQGVDRPKDTPPAPKGLDWDLWLGVASERPYHPAYVPFKWRGWKDFGTGAVGDMGIHNAAMPFVGLRLGPPRSVEIVETSGLKEETFPEWSILRYQFPARGDQPALTLHWYEGGKKPSSDLIFGRKVAENGAILVGDKGTLYSIEWTGGDWHLLPEHKFRDFKPPQPSEPRSPGHHAEWIRACKGGPAAYCNFIDFAAAITEVMLLGVLALRTGSKIEWDAAAMRAPNCPEAEQFIRRQYRKGWGI